MWLLFRAELRRFRFPGILNFIAHLVMLGFLSRTSDLAQEPIMAYRVMAACYALGGILLGAYQMATYARPAAWVQLIHRPLSPWRIGLALLAAGAVWIAIAIALPILLIAAWQAGFTARVVDLRHLLLALPAFTCALIGYASAAYAVLANRRIGFGVVMFLVLIPLARAQAGDALLLQWLMVGYLGVLLWIVFRPARSVVPASPWRLGMMLVPTVFAVYLVVLGIFRIGIQVVWIVFGAAPATAAVPPPDSVQESARATDKALMLKGLAASHDASAQRWIAEVGAQEKLERYGPFFEELPTRQQFTNPVRLNFADSTNDTIWTFSHDRMRFVGRGLADDRSDRGTLAPPQAAAFATPVMPVPGVLGAGHADSVVLLGERNAWRYEPHTRSTELLLQLPGEELFATMPMRVNTHLMALSDRALYVGNDMAFPDHGTARIPLDGPINVLSRVSVADVDDGYLLSLTFMRTLRQESFPRVQYIVHVDHQGQWKTVATRPLAHDFPAWYRFVDWWMSPALDRATYAIKSLFATHRDLDPEELGLPPANILWLAVASAVLSMTLTLIRSRRLRLSPKATVAWVVVNAILGPAGVMVFWLAAERAFASVGAHTRELRRHAPVGGYADQAG